MTEDSILVKLGAFLIGDIDSECKVIYVLVECRKLFSRYKPIPFALNMYCNWALHVDLEISRTTRQFLEQIDAFVVSLFRGSANIQAENIALGHLVLLETLSRLRKKSPRALVFLAFLSRA